MRLDGFGIMVNDMAVMVHFYRDVLGFEIKEDENTTNGYEGIGIVCCRAARTLGRSQIHSHDG